ncbi:MAG: MmcQ/YjbR family DNA-binding protein [Pseudomonadota bacterium]
MTRDEYNLFCAELPSTTHVVQWYGADVWKVGGKMFAAGWWTETEGLHVTFKVSPLAFDILRDQPGCMPAPYMASRGMKWIQRLSDESLDDDGLRDYIRESYRMAVQKLTKKVRAELELEIDK